MTAPPGYGKTTLLAQWAEAAGLYLAALYLREGGAVGRAAVSFDGDDRLVSEYMEAEFLGASPPRGDEARAAPA